MQPSQPSVVSPVDAIASPPAAFPHFMLAEIHQQPAAIRACLDAYVDGNALFPQTAIALSCPASRSAGGWFAPLNEIHILASGSSRHAGLVAQAWLEQLAGIPTRVRAGSEFSEAPLPLTAQTVTIAVTQSGETADTLAALTLDQERRSQQSAAYQGRSLGITNHPDSRLGHSVDVVIPTLAGTEIGIAATKTFTTQLLVFYLLALGLAAQRQRIDRDRAYQALTALRQLPAQMQQVIQQAETIQAIATQLHPAQHCIVLGRGINRAIALEGALKLKETTYLHAEGYAAGEFRHGPIALLDERVPVIAIAPTGSDPAPLLSTLHQAKAHGSPLIGILTSDQSPDCMNLCDATILLPPVDPDLSPLLTVLPLQLLAYYLAVHRGLDVDRPRHLTKTLSADV